MKLETQEKLREVINEQIAKIRAGHGNSCPIFGKLKDIVLPSETAIKERVSNIFSTLEVDIIELPLTLESARAAVVRIIKKIRQAMKKEKNSETA